MTRSQLCSLVFALAAMVPVAYAQTSVAVPAVIAQFKVEGENPIGEAQAQRVLQAFTGEAPTLDRLQEASAALEKALRDAGYGFFRVNLPPQETSGTITLKIIQFPIGKLTLSNNKFFDDANIRASVPALTQGQTPNTQRLARALAVANENPAKRLTAAFKEGSVPDTIDVALEVADNRPWYGFMQLNNSGTGGNTGRWRVTGGLSHANLWNLDHQGTLTYTTSPEHWNEVKQFGFNYKAPIYALGGMITAYYSYSTVFSGVVADAFRVTGGGRFGGISYTQYLAPRGDYRDYVTLGIDDKYFINDTRFIQSNAALGGNARTRPLTATYTGRYEQKWGSVGFNVDYARNWRSGANNTDAAYVASPRAGASSAWSAWRGGLDALYALPADWSLNAKLRGQAARVPLLSGEQFGLGGVGSVRGVPDRAISGESGFSSTLEVLSPQWNVWDGGLRALGFVEGGKVYREYRGIAPTTPLKDSIASTGLGLRYSYKTLLSINLDYGRVISPSATIKRGTDKLHATFIIKY